MPQAFRTERCFSYRLAAEMSDTIAAIAPVAGTMPTEIAHPKRPVPVIHFHGTRDEFVPINGGVGRKSISKTDFLSVEYSIQTWVKINRTKVNPLTVRLPDAKKDKTRVVRKTYPDGRNGAEVVLYEIEGGGHTWPGRPVRLRYLGPSTMDISANDPDVGVL